MITIDEGWKTVDDYTSRLSTIARHLAFAAAAICWFFKTTTSGGNIVFPNCIYFSLIFLVLYFLLDILQYLTATVCRKSIIDKEEKKLSKWSLEVKGCHKFTMPKSVDTWPYIFFYLKLSALAIAFLGLVIHFVIGLSQ
jgi:hypothetical protein